MPKRIVDQSAVLAAYERGDRTQTAIARELGVTRQRINQITGPIRDSLGPDAITFKAAMERFKIARPTIKKWIRSGEITALYGRVSAIEIGELVEALRARPCRVCGKPIGAVGFLSCPEHRRGGGDYPSYPYRLWSERRRATFKRLMDQWAQRNPEKAARIQARASMVWRLVKFEGMDREEARKLARARWPYWWKGEADLKGVHLTSARE